MSTENAEIRHDSSWTEVLALFELPFSDLLFRAHHVHRLYIRPREVQISTLLSIKTGICPEDCRYCPQGVPVNNLLPELNTCKIPASFVGGSRDRTVRPESFKHAAVWMPDARACLIPTIGHTPFVSHEDRFLEIIREFLQ